MRAAHKLTIVFLLLLLVIVFVLLLMLAQMTATQGAAFGHPGLRVEVRWLTEHQPSGSVVLVDARTEQEYENGHLESAVNVPWNRFLDGQGRFVGPAAAHVLGDAGISPDDEVVVMGGDSSEAAAYVFWVLDAFGHAKLHLLTEPIRQVRSEGIPVVTTASRRVPSAYAAELRPECLASAEWLAAHHADPGLVILDVRVLTGSPEAPCIPGARPVSANPQLWLAAGSGRTALDLYAAALRGADVTPGSAVAVYGENGRQASVAYFVLRLMGLDSVRLYDGGWREWSSDPTRPVGRMKVAAE